MGWPTVALIPYDQRLERFPAYVQQLDMESNGKRVTLDGHPVATATGPVIWGEPGTNAQHSFFQLLHQGTDIVPVDFIAAARPRGADEAHHTLLLANCFAQGQALAFGRNADEVRAEMQSAGKSADEIARLVPHRTFPGDRPSTTILFRELDPFTLGRLVALFEHKVFVQGAIWDVNSFDQWGVELGKALAGALIPALGEGAARPGGPVDHGADRPREGAPPMTPLTIAEICGLAPVIPVLIVDEVAHAAPLARALVEGGLPALEVTLRTPAALDAIRAMAEAAPDAVVGAGTLRSAADVRQAAAAGARFGVSPGLSASVLDAAAELGLPMLPGVATPTEAMAGAERGLDILKFFPAEANGGAPVLRAWESPLAGLSFCPTGGVGLDNAREYLGLRNVVCVGGSWVAPKSLVAGGDWDGITRLARQAAALSRP